MKNNHSSDHCCEEWKPLPHVPPDNVTHALLFRLRLFFDFEVLTVYRDLGKVLRQTAGKVLEVGCGMQPYRHLLSPQTEYLALDWEGSDRCFGTRVKDTLYYDGTRFPVADRSFNLLFHTEVLEHIYPLRSFLSECYRVLKDNGQMVFTIPFAARNHYIPYDYWRLTPASLTRLLQEARFTDIVVVPRGGDMTVAIHKMNSVCYRLILRNIPSGLLRLANRACFTLLFAAPVLLFTLAGHLSLLFKLGSPDDPLGYTVYCGKTATSAAAS
jgi:SAM-dependent methyltransferase